MHEAEGCVILVWSEQVQTHQGTIMIKGAWTRNLKRTGRSRIVNRNSSSLSVAQGKDRGHEADSDLTVLAT